MGFEPTFIVALVFAVLILVFVIKGLMIIQQSEAVVIERLGSYNKTLGPGVNWVIPFIDQPRSIKVRRYRAIGGENVAMVTEEVRIDRRETVLDFPGQSVVTADNVSVNVNGALYFQVIDPERAVYQTENLIQAIEILAKTSLRSEMGKMELDKLFESRQEINDKLQLVMDEAGNKWGVKVTRVEIQDIIIPAEVEDAMRKQMAAERERRALVLRASGEREAAIAKAEGEKRSSILVAEGSKEAAILMAEGQRKAIDEVLSAGDSRLDPQLMVGYLLGLEYLKTLPEIGKKGDRIFLPFEASSVLGAVGSIEALLNPRKISG
ncbi:stomatin [Oceanisphaera profunda]|uniref:Stomatin n=1 Tax=Oceanisphaera profunda TaxID=1416627 RepID=A0A1Y0D8E2_9GAMM|nr:SPFH domain-containing protein [Oceanisphaera profunda]ART83822.1 stomatin [Oceanisphaera profunda]